MFSKKNKEPETVEILGKPFVCPVCSNSRFYRGKAQLNTAALSFLNLDWANKSATYIACSDCGHINWFSQLNQ